MQQVTAVVSSSIVVLDLRRVLTRLVENHFPRNENKLSIKQLRVSRCPTIVNFNLEELKLAGIKVSSVFTLRKKWVTQSITITSKARAGYYNYSDGLQGSLVV